MLEKPQTYNLFIKMSALIIFLDKFIELRYNRFVARINTSIYGPLAQLAEQFVYTEWVGDSSSSGAIHRDDYYEVSLYT